jgi:hypothetical protein
MYVSTYSHIQICVCAKIFDTNNKLDLTFFFFFFGDRISLDIPGCLELAAILLPHSVGITGLHFHAWLSLNS